MGAPICLGWVSGVTKRTWLYWLGRAFNYSLLRELAGERAASPCRGGEQAAGAGRGETCAALRVPPRPTAPRRSRGWQRRRSGAFLEEVDLFLYLKQVMFMQRHMNDSRSEGQI